MSGLRRVLCIRGRMNFDQEQLTVNKTGGDWATEGLFSNFVHTKILPGISWYTFVVYSPNQCS